MEKNLENAKVGDKVIISTGWSDVTIGVIEKITPKGFLKVGNLLFYTDGRERASGWYTAHIRLATQEDIVKIAQKNFVRKTLRFLHSLKNIDYEKAVKVMDILGEENENIL